MTLPPTERPPYNAAAKRAVEERPEEREDVEHHITDSTPPVPPAAERG